MRKKYIKYLLLCLLVSATVLSGCAEKAAEEGKGSMAGQSGTVGLDDAAGQGGTAGQSGNVGRDGESMLLSGQEELAQQVVFEGKDMEGNVVSSDIFAQSKLTMVNVWATYCNPCLSEMPGLGELAGEYASEDFRLIGIISDVQEGADQRALDVAAKLIDQTSADYTHLLLNESLYYALLTEVTAVPTTFFIDEKGVVLDVVIGAKDKSVWKEKIDGFLEE